MLHCSYGVAADGLYVEGTSHKIIFKKTRKITDVQRQYVAKGSMSFLMQSWISIGQKGIHYTLILYFLIKMIMHTCLQHIYI